MKPSRDPLLTLVETYFQNHLRRVRGASEHTVRAYRDSLRLFFLFLAERTKRPPMKLRLDDVNIDGVLAFLDYVEEKRANRVATRNCRLAAIRGFVEHLLRHDFSRAEQYRRILAIPSKKSRARPVEYLEPEEMAVVLAQPSAVTSVGARDRALLLFLYNTGARVAEALAVRPADLQLDRPRQVRLHGKGGKERFCPLWAETAAALKNLCSHGLEANSRVFRNARGAPMTRDGVAYLIAKYVRSATSKLKILGGRRVTPHVFRHSCAVALLQAGVDVSVIRDYLGHASVATTSRYITTNLDMKREVLQAFWQRSGLVRRKTRAWRPSSDVLAFLQSL